MPESNLTTLRIPVEPELYHKLVELKGKFKADDWPALMQCFVNEEHWRTFARPLVNTLLEWAQSNPPREPELLKKLGFVFMDDVDGKGNRAVLFPSSIDEIVSIQHGTGLHEPEALISANRERNPR